MKGSSRVILVTALAVLFVSPLAAAQQTVNVSFNTSETSSWAQGAKKFKKLVEEQSDYTVRLHPNASMAGGNDRMELSMTQSGSLQFVIKSTTWLTALNKKFQVIGLPWLFPNHDVANAVLDGPAGDKLLESLKSKGLVGLAWGTNGFRQVTNSKHPIKEVGDFKDLDIRVPGIPLYLDIFKALGASPTTMNFADVFTALQTGAIDGQENPLSLIWSSHFYDVQDYLTIWNYSYDAIAFISSASFWNSLNEQDQKMFAQAAQKSMDYERSVVKEDDKTIPGKLEKAGMKITRLSDDQVRQFKEKLIPIEKKYRKEIGSDLVDTFLENVDKQKDSD